MYRRIMCTHTTPPVLYSIVSAIVTTMVLSIVVLSIVMLSIVVLSIVLLSMVVLSRIVVSITVVSMVSKSPVLEVMRVTDARRLLSDPITIKCPPYTDSTLTIHNSINTIMNISSSSSSSSITLPAP